MYRGSNSNIICFQWKGTDHETSILILLAALLAASASSCASGEIQEEQINAPDVETESVDTAAPDEPETAPALPDKTFDGYAFRIMSSSDQLAYLHAAEMNGEKLNDAIYTANKEVEEQFDVLLTPVVIENIMDTEILRNSIMSGNDDYDLSYMHNTHGRA